MSRCLPPWSGQRGHDCVLGGALEAAVELIEMLEKAQAAASMAGERSGHLQMQAAFTH